MARNDLQLKKKSLEFSVFRFFFCEQSRFSLDRSLPDYWKSFGKIRAYAGWKPGHRTVLPDEAGEEHMNNMGTAQNAAVPDENAMSPSPALQLDCSSSKRRRPAVRTKEIARCIWNSWAERSSQTSHLRRASDRESERGREIRVKAYGAEREEESKLRECKRFPSWGGEEEERASSIGERARERSPTRVE